MTRGHASGERDTPPKTGSRRSVTVIAGYGAAEQQPQTFQMCPLGLQFHTTRPMEEFTTLALDIDVPGGGGTTEKITCTGAVVRCQRVPHEDRYRVWVKFLDLPKETSERIRCASKDGLHLCSYCENF